MSIDSARISCTGCSYKAIESYRPILLVYRIGDREIETSRARGWCYACDAMTDIDVLDTQRLSASLDVVDAERNELQNRLGRLSHGFVNRLLHWSERERIKSSLLELSDKSDETWELLRIARRRNSRPRCLHCWSEDTAPVTFDPEDRLARDFRHECGGMLRLVEDQTLPRLHFSLTTYVFDEMGEFIDKRTENRRDDDETGASNSVGLHGAAARLDPKKYPRIRLVTKPEPKSVQIIGGITPPDLRARQRKNQEG